MFGSRKGHRGLYRVEEWRGDIGGFWQLRLGSKGLPKFRERVVYSMFCMIHREKKIQKNMSCETLKRRKLCTGHDLGSRE